MLRQYNSQNTKNEKYNSTFSESRYNYKTKILQLENTIGKTQNQELSTEDDLTTSLTESGRMRELQDKVPWL